MPVDGKTYNFTQQNVDSAPDEHGVYCLLKDGIVIYYGRAKVTTIRQRLQRHFNGDEGSCTQNATHYKREVCGDPAGREVELLEAYKQTYGRLPSCNERIG